MTIETTTPAGEPLLKSGPYEGDGVATVFDYEFQIQQEEELFVSVLLDGATAGTTLDLLTDYTVSGVGADGGGQITLTSASLAPAGSLLVIEYKGDYNQSVEWSNQGRIQLSILENSFDKVFMHLRAIKELADRSLKVEQFETTSPDDLIAELREARDTAEASASEAEVSAAEAALYDGPRFDDDEEFFLSELSFDAGTLVLIRENGFVYQAVDNSTGSTVDNSGGQSFELVFKPVEDLDLPVPLHYITTTTPSTIDAQVPTDARFTVSGVRGHTYSYLQAPAGTYSDSPQTFDMLNGEQAYIRNVHYAAAGLDGVYTARFGHRAGDMQYQVFNSGYARLLGDLEKFKPRQIEGLAFRVKYVDGVNGSDANDGLTWATANKTIRYALDNSACDILYVAKGVYYEDSFTWDRTTSLSVLAVGGQVEIVYGTLNTDTFGAWGTDGAYPNTRVLNVSSGGTATAVVDRQYCDTGGPKRLNKVGSLAVCNSTPDTFYQSTASAAVYVHRASNGGDISGDEVVVSVDQEWEFQLRDATAAGEPGPTKVFLKGITIYGGKQNLTIRSFNSIPDEGTVFFAEDCRFLASTDSNALSIFDVGLAIFVRCGATKPNRDGFNYKGLNGVSSHGIEVDCFARDNGVSGDSNNNGSTAHDDCRVLRINTHVNYSSGPAIADVDTSKSWNVCCTAQFGSTSNYSANQTVEAWLHGGYYVAATTDIDGERRDIRAQANAVVHLNAVTTGFPAYAQDTATIDGDGW